MRKYFRVEVQYEDSSTGHVELEALSEDDAVETLERDGLRALVVREINGPVF